MKKTCLFLLTAVMLGGVSSCGGGDDDGPNYCQQLADMTCAKVAICLGIAFTQDDLNRCGQEVKAKIDSWGYNDDNCEGGIGELNAMTCSDILAQYRSVASPRSIFPPDETLRMLLK